MAQPCSPIDKATIAADATRFAHMFRRMFLVSINGYIKLELKRIVVAAQCQQGKKSNA